MKMDITAREVINVVETNIDTSIKEKVRNKHLQSLFMKLGGNLLPFCGCNCCHPFCVIHASGLFMGDIIRYYQVL